MCHGGGMRVTGVDACRRGWVAVSLDAPEGAEGPTGLAVVIPARPQRDDRGQPIAIRY